MTPEFRAAIFKWEYDEAKDGPKDECIPFQLQSLFGHMTITKSGSLTTEKLTKSFGWGNSEAFQQQVVQVSRWRSQANEWELSRPGLCCNALN